MAANPIYAPPANAFFFREVRNHPEVKNKRTQRENWLFMRICLVNGFSAATVAITNGLR